MGGFVWLMILWSDLILALCLECLLLVVFSLCLYVLLLWFCVWCFCFGV